MLVVVGLVLALGCSEKKKDARAGGEGGGEGAGGGGGGGTAPGEVFGCAIAIAPAEPPPGAPEVVYQGKAESPIEAEAHKLAEADACQKAGAPPDCVTSGKFVKKSGSITKQKK